MTILPGQPSASQISCHLSLHQPHVSENGEFAHNRAITVTATRSTAEPDSVRRRWLRLRGPDDEIGMVPYYADLDDVSANIDI